jgi:hypothetical protein
MKERSYMEDLNIDGRIMLKLILKQQSGRAWTGLIWVRIGKSGGLVEDGTEISVSITRGKF